MVSVAMAAYNGGQFISRQIDSILCQLDKEDELIAAVNPSTDNTLEILNHYREQDKRIRIIVNPNPGVNGNFNVALMECKGDYIFISDQDDIWDKNKIRIICDYFHKGYEVVFHNSVSIDENDCIISNPFFQDNVVNVSIIRTFLKPRQSGCCMAFTKDFMTSALPIPKRVESYDHWLAMKAVLDKHVIVLDDVLIMHRIHDHNVTTKKKRKISEIIKSRMNMFLALVVFRGIA